MTLGSVESMKKIKLLGETNHSISYRNKEKASAFLRPVGNPISKAAQELEGFENSVIDKKDSVSDKPIILATVKGDIHDIGKNIVKVVLESYGFEVADLGKDVPPQTVCDAIASTGAKLVGLSALMTTTVPAMEETIALIKKTYPHVKVVVGGAVLTEEYASVIGADYYAADAMDTAKIAGTLLKK